MRHYSFVDYATQAYSALVTLLILFLHNGTVPHWPLLVGAHLAGLLAVHFLIEFHSRGRPGTVLDFLRHFYPVPMYLWFFAETGWLNRMAFHAYMDPLAIRWDQTLFGCQPGVLFMQKLPYLAMSELFYAAYFSYYLMIVGVGVALYWRSRQQFFHYISVTSFVFYLCYLVYIFLPIIGPRVFLHEIPGYQLPPELQQLAPAGYYPGAIKGGIFFRLVTWLYEVFEAPGAAFPSSHVAIALTTVYFSFRYLRPIRYPHLVVAVLLCFSTVYCRYHYGVDVLGGILTAAVLVPLGNWLYFHYQESAPAPAKEARAAQQLSQPGT